MEHSQGIGGFPCRPIPSGPVGWSEVPEGDSNESTLRLIASPSIKNAIIDINGDHDESFDDPIDLIHGGSHTLAVLMTSRIRHDVWGWQCLFQIQAGKKLMIQVGFISKDLEGLHIVGISGREEYR